MKLYETSEDYKLVVYDLETIRCYFLAFFYNPDTEEWLEFEISEYKNDLYALMKFYHSSNIDFAVGYNNLGFDAQVLNYIQSTHEQWFNNTNLEITNLIYSFVQNLIEGQKYGMRLPYYESQFLIKQLDCFTILGLNNAARLSSLKSLQFRLKWYNVETMSIHHSTENMSLEDIENVKSYCRNDILSTYEVFKLVLGNTDDELYKGNNQMEFRNSIKEEFKLDCFNYSDIKIGEELMISAYLEDTKTKRENFPKRGTFRKYIKLSDCIPDYLKFNTEELSELLKAVKRRTINQDESIDYKFNFYSTNYELKSGGLHSKNENEIYKSNEEYVIYTSDVGSFYPISSIRRKIFPAQLGEKFLKTYEKRYNKRMELKPLSKKDKTIKGICDGIKLQLNIVFGKMGSKVSPFFDMKALYSITIGNEFTLLKLIEDLELNNFHVISANTDGIEVLVKRSEEQKYLELCEEWCNLTQYTLEHDKYDWIIYSSINDYIAKTIESKYKFKGDFVSDVELYKNPSKRIIPLSLQQYFINGVKPEDFIPNHKDILDFCIRGKANSSTSLFLKYDNGESIDVGSLIRYYLTKNKTAPQLFKIGEGSKDNSIDANQNAPNELGIQRVKLFNKIVDGPYNIDYEQYIYQTYKIIAKIEKNKKDLNYVDSILNKDQFKLF
jgi:hypothetical protein